MKKLCINCNCDKPRAADVLGRISAKARALGMELYADEPTAGLLKNCRKLAPPALFDAVDAVMAIGGDGTMLRAVRELGECEKPMIGLNIGSLGFLTSVSENELDHAMECLAQDRFECSARAIAECSVSRDGRETGKYRALNDVVVARGVSPRLLSLDVLIDGEKVTTYACDGLIVATPTGSTGHALSAGGPIVYPEASVFVVSLICPHTLSSRPLVIPDSREICIVPARNADAVVLTVDGQVGQQVERGDCVKVRNSRRNVRFIHLPEYSYFSVLRHKLNWSGSPV